MINPSRKFALGVSDFSTSEPFTNAERIIASGIDFVEPSLAKASVMPDGEFEAVASRFQSAGIEVLSMNWFLPSTLKVVGPEANEKQARDFLDTAFYRAARLGARAIVLGSPDSRTIPDGFSLDQARQQMIDFCRWCSDAITKNDWDFKMAVEHVNHTETNFINTFAEALAIVRDVDRPEIGLTADFHHFAMENEPTDIMLEASGQIFAVQLANPVDRRFPKPGDTIPGMKQFFQHLIEAGYEGGVSVEAFVGDDLEVDCQGASDYLSRLIDELV